MIKRIINNIKNADEIMLCVNELQEQDFIILNLKLDCANKTLTIHTIHKNYEGLNSESIRKTLTTMFSITDIEDIVIKKQEEVEMN